jgi:hypothetical protein
MYAPFLLTGLIGILYHFRMQMMLGDDTFFSRALEEQGLMEYLTYRYGNWTSRLVLEFLMVTVEQVPLLWKILDFLMFASLPVLLAEILGGGIPREQKTKSENAGNMLINWCAAGAFLIFPFHDMGTAGWMTTTIVFFWPLWGMVFIGMLISRLVRGRQIAIWQGICGWIACLVASSHEQVSVTLLAIFLMYSYYRIQIRKKGSQLTEVRQGNGMAQGQGDATGKQGKRVCWNNIVLAGLLLINLVSLFSIVVCPGNTKRNAVSIADLPIYATFGFADKLYLGLLSVERVFIANADIVFFFASLLLAVLVYWKTDNWKKTAISSLPLLILFGQTVVRAAYPGLSGLFPVPGEITEWSWGALSTWLPMLYLAIALAAMVYGYYQILGENRHIYLFTLIFLGCGFGAGVVLGFVATIYVSGERVYMLLYAALLFVSLYCICSMRDVVQEKLRQASGKLLFGFFGLLCLINVGFIALSV